MKDDNPALILMGVVALGILIAALAVDVCRHFS